MTTTMPYATLPGTDLSVSRVSLGCNNFGGRLDADGARGVVDAALGNGINFFDTADAYGQGASEELLGLALAGRRDQAVVATKFGLPMGENDRGSSPAYVRRACEASLRRLRTDHIDLYYQHAADPEVPIEDTLGALDELVQAGKVRHIAVSNSSAQQIAEAVHTAQDRDLPRFVAAQLEWNLLEREVENSLVPACEKQAMAVIPFYPLAAGMLTGKYRKGQPFPPGSRFDKVEYFAATATDEALSKVENLLELARKLDRPLSELALAWLDSRPQIASVLVGSSSPAQVEQNLTHLQRPLDVDEVALVDEFLAGH
ncbi:aldo/keto reductase [Rhodococcus sp. D2-41]|uniref:Aldo/keto reductase n=1 Tax=Speluncibacter jeojiensis TaxID=2710754 RepID=A0A9X4M2B3_9ACTN|nr:aldo/keto reductase [Rhodococcus sp. D2-41]MDG3008681.1 aldo/keto reductase [Rhodococcus sp. D2-41]MDG3013111.1 aldo/keto reductase [Corynebacteriales bacterium D3-21]